MGITRGFCEHGYENSIFFLKHGTFYPAEGGQSSACWGNWSIGVSAYENACNTAVRLHARNHCRRSCRTIAAVLSVQVSHYSSRRTRSRAFRFHFNIILKSDFRIFNWSTLSIFSSKMFKKFSSPHAPHVLLFGVIILCSKYKLWTPSRYVTLPLTVSLPPINSDSKAQSSLKRNFPSVTNSC
jgi:hypothetical protein